MKKKTALVIGAGGFIGSHMVKRLKDEGYFVRAVDLHLPYFSHSPADEFYTESITHNTLSRFAIKGGFDEVYQFAADMGGAGYIFSGEHDSDILVNSLSINVACAQAATLTGVKKFFFSSSACVYPQELQTHMVMNNLGLKESDAYPANPDSVYGWEKLMSEITYQTFARNHGLDVRIARFHNIYGPEGTFDGGKEKAPAAMCRKVIIADDENKYEDGIDRRYIEVWGDGQQTRSFLYIDECIEGVRRMMYNADVIGFDHHYIPVLNIGSDEMVTINELAQMAINISGKYLQIKNIESTTLGVRGRNSDNTLIENILGWKPNYPLRDGMEKTYKWIYGQMTDPIMNVFKNPTRKN